MDVNESTILNIDFKSIENDDEEKGYTNNDFLNKTPLRSVKSNFYLNNNSREKEIELEEQN